MLREHRWQKIEEALSTQPFLEIRDLAELLRVSDATVRRDIEALHQSGRVKRTRGGVTLQDTNTSAGSEGSSGQLRTAAQDESLEHVATFSQRAKTNADAKEKIGTLAASLIRDGQSILIAGGSTPYAAAKNLRLRRVSVATNSLPTAALLGETLGVDVLVTGGVVYPKHNILIGPQLKQTLQSVRAADWLLLGASGADEEGFFDSNHLEVEAQRELMSRANNVALLMDASKFQRRDMVLVAPWEEIDVLVTDSPPPKELMSVLKRAKVRVLLKAELFEVEPCKKLIMSEQIYNERAMREEICEIGHRVWQREYVAANDGNISVRLNEREILCTPTGVSKGFLTPDMLCLIDRNGAVLKGNLKPSSEIKMHRDFYEARPDVRAVCHAHPITATGFAVAGIPLDRCTLPEVVITLGAVPLVKYGVPGTDELTRDILENYVNDYDAFLLANHGVVTVGQSLMNAYYKMETVEHFAKITLAARQLGNENVFSPPRAQELVDARTRYGVQAGAGCRIEHKDASYAPEVPMSGAGASGYAKASNEVANGSTPATNCSAKSGSSNEIEMSEAEVAQLVKAIASRVVGQIRQ